MEDVFSAEIIAKYSLALTFVIDLLSRIPKLSGIMTGVGKQLTSVVIGVGFCLLTNTNAFAQGSGTSGEVLSGILLAAVAGLGWSKLAGILGSSKTIMENKADNVL